MNNKLTEFGLNQFQGRDHFSVLEHPFLSYNVLFCFRTSFSCFRASFSALSRFVPHPVPDFGCPGPSRPEFWLSRPVPSLGKIFSLSRCPFVPGQGRNFCPVVLKSCTVPSRWKRYFVLAYCQKKNPEEKRPGLNYS